MKDITFLRHGEITAANSGQKLRDINFADLKAFKLSDKGIAQIEEAGNALRNESFDVIICGTSRRTIESGFIVSKKIIHPHQFFCEDGIDAWKANKNSNYISADDYWKMYFQFTLCNGEASPESKKWETFEELAERTLRALKKYEKFEHPLVIAHSIIISLYVGLPRDGIEYGKFYKKSGELKPEPPNFAQFT